MNPTPSTAESIFEHLLDESSALLGATEDGGIALPEDELHREILLPLLPAMLCDGAIRKHWREQAATGFLARLRRHLHGGESAPRWTADDFEIHVAASYTAGPDAKALADTLLSEGSLREMAASLMNQILDALRPAFVEPEAVEAGEAVPPPVETIVIPDVRPQPLAPAAARLQPVTAARRFPRVERLNPISGTRNSHGGLGAPDWTAGYPLR
jgi:hypothetical protein